MEKKYNQLPDLKLMETFHCVVQLKRFTLAAKELYISQGAVSKRIKQLEELLGFSLFIRKNNRLMLTGKGKSLHTWFTRQYADLLEGFKALREVKNKFQEQPSHPSQQGTHWRQTALSSVVVFPLHAVPCIWKGIWS